MKGAGTNEGEIMNVMRNTSDEERVAINREYIKKYDKPLISEFSSELNS